MDVLVYFTIVTIVAILDNGKTAKVNSCDSTPASNGKCNLTVTNGQPCYFGNPKQFASISCNSSYTFDAQTTFTCTGTGNTGNWTPAASAVCSSGSTPTPTMSFTSNSSLSSVISTGTPSLETYTTMPRTGINTLSTDFQTDPSAITPFTSSPRLAATSSTIVVASSILVTVTPGPAAAHKVKESGTSINIFIQF
ncbi:mucin-2-like isoform X2 [Ruditapes philippinarum]|uniref:mucin-2-like isoform X2 n=1 Tax=Ruditapes philippinarum TaxID=129788 RepID=UPI00295B405D|nr:mucin-2-like isoform X2 [Ruditapes philippinarum]